MKTVSLAGDGNRIIQELYCHLFHRIYENSLPCRRRKQVVVSVHSSVITSIHMKTVSLAGDGNLSLNH